MEALKSQSGLAMSALKARASSILKLLSDRYRPSGHTFATPSSRGSLQSCRSRGLTRSYPPTNGKAGGKLPAGNAALRSPALSFSAASRKAATNHAIALPELIAHPGAQRMEERRGRSLGALRTIVGMLAQDRRDAQRLAACSRPSGRGLLVDLMDQVESPRSPDFGRKVLPAGERERGAAFRRSRTGDGRTSLPGCGRRTPGSG